MNIVTKHGYAAAEHVTNRLDALDGKGFVVLGVSRWFFVVLMITGGAWTLNALQTMSFVYLLPAIGASIEMDDAQYSVLSGIGFLGSFVGNVVVGNLADTYGRRPMMLAAFFLSHIACAMSALSWNVTALNVFRFLVGVGLGGGHPAMATLIVELAPTRIRGSTMVWLDSFWAIGTLLALFVAFDITPLIQWRYTFLLNLGSILYGIAIFYFIPESPKWLASVGRYHEAIATLQVIEIKSGVYRDIRTEQHEIAILESSEQMVHQTQSISFVRQLVDRFRILFRYPYFIRTIMLWTIWNIISLSYYAIDTYFHTRLLVSMGVGADQVINYVVAFGAIPGYIAAAYLVERVGRRQSLAGFLVGSFIASIALAHAPITKYSVMITGTLLSFFLLGAWGCLYAYTLENYPITARAVGFSYASGVSRFGAFLGPLLVNLTSVMKTLSHVTFLWVFGGLLLAAALLLIMYGYETNGQDMDAGMKTSHVTESYVTYDEPFYTESGTSIASLRESETTSYRLA